jgi:ABC-type multidrug transport system fused ATPase/permease subunit
MFNKTKTFLGKTAKIMAFAKPVWHLYAGVSGLSLLSQMLGLVQPWLMMFFLDDVLINKRFDLFPFVIAGFVGIQVINGLFGMVNDLMNARLTQKQQLHIQLMVYEHLQRLKMIFFYRKKVGDLLTRIDSDALEIQSFIMTLIQTFFLSVINFVVIIFISLKLNAQVTLITLCVFPFYFISEYFWVKILKKYARKIRTKYADIFSFLEETLDAIKSIKIFTREKDVRDEYREKMEFLNRLYFKNVLTSDVAGLMNSFILYLPTLVVLLLGGYQVLLGALTVGGLLALQQYINRLFGPIVSFISVNRTLQLQMVSIDRVLEIINARPEDNEKPGARELHKVKGNIQFKNVKFRYKKNYPLLENINIRIESGKHIGLVGKSGIGKTTLINLILRFYQPDSGKILLDGIDINDIKLQSLRSKIGFVSQEVSIFHKSIKENIAFGKPGATMEEIINAAKISQIHDHISKLPKQYATIVGEHGAMLSAGERQRLSIARVVLKNPDIIILDEPTTYLDSKTEEQIKNAMDLVIKGKTAIVIAHRLSTLQNIDEIWVLADGQIAEKGTFEELINNKSRFFTYYISQFGGIEMFRARLKTELERAIKYRKPISILKLTIQDWATYDQDTMAGNDLIAKIVLVLSRHLEDMYFLTDIPEIRGTFLIALPESGKKEAEKISSSIQTEFSKKFPGLSPLLKPVFTSSFKTEMAGNITSHSLLNRLFRK